MNLNIHWLAQKSGFGPSGIGPTNAGPLRGDHQGWDVRVVLENAKPLLESAEIQQALDQVQLTADDLRAILSSHAEELMCSPRLDDCAFIEPTDWDQVRRSIRKPWLVPAALTILGALCASLVVFFGWVVTVCVLAVVSYLAVLGTVFILLRRPRFRAPLRPTAETSDNLRRQAIGPFIREQLNRMLDEQDYPLDLRVSSAPGLAELTDREQVVTTDTSVRLTQLSRDMPTGSIGISGPRGAGKTTLLRNFCDATLKWLDTSKDADRSDLRIMVSAPVDYDAREFILHLFARLCETFLTYWPSANATRRRRKRRSVVAIPGSALAVVGATVIGWDLLVGARRLPHLTSVDLSLTIGGILVVIGIGLLLAGVGPTSWQAEPEGRMNLWDEARMWQTRLRYLQAFTTGYSGTIGLPAGACCQAGSPTCRN